MARYVVFSLACLACFGYGRRDHTGYAQLFKTLFRFEGKQSSNWQAPVDKQLHSWKALARLLRKFHPAAMLKVSNSRSPTCFVIGIDASAQYLARAAILKDSAQTRLTQAAMGFDHPPEVRRSYMAHENMWKTRTNAEKSLEKESLKAKVRRKLQAVQRQLKETEKRLAPSAEEQRLIDFNTNISKCEDGGQWKKALSLLQQMRNSSVEPNLISYCAAISVCEKAGKRQEALSLIKDFRNAEIQLGLKRYNGSDVSAEELPELKLDERVLYEDEDLIVLDKPSNCVVHPSDGHWDRSLLNGIMHYLQKTNASFDWKEREHLKAWPGVVHRLDRCTSGCIVFAKNAIAHAILVRTFAEHKTRKDYLCVSHGKPVWPQIKVETLIAQHPKTREMFMTKPLDTKDLSGKIGIGKSTVHTLGWWPLACQKGRHASLFSVNIQTGRTHQVRVHMQHLGAPIIGDDLYGWKKPNKWCKNRYAAMRPLLHAHSLSFPHPMRPKETVSVKAPIPEDFHRIAGLAIKELPIYDTKYRPLEQVIEERYNAQEQVRKAIEERPAEDIPELCPETTWQVELKDLPQKNKLGLKVFFGDKRILKVVGIQAGPMSEWNSNNPDKAVREGDYITEINGLSGDNVEMLHVVSQSEKLQLVLNRD